MLHTRVITFNAGGSATQSGTIGISPERYAGAYFRYDGGGTANLQVTNMGRDLLNHSGAADKYLQELLVGAETLADGDIVGSVTGAAPNSHASLLLFFHRD